MRAEILRFARLSLSRMHPDGATSRGSSPSTHMEGSDDRKREDMIYDCRVSASVTFTMRAICFTS